MALSQNILDESSHKSNRIWVDKDSEFYNRSMKSFFQSNDIEYIQSILMENLLLLKDVLEPWKLKVNESYKYMTSVSKNVYIYKLDDIVNKYNNTYSTIIVMPADVKLNIYWH